MKERINEIECFEPSIAEEIFTQAKNALEKALKDGVKKELEDLRTRNKNLEILVFELRQKIREYESAQQPLEYSALLNEEDRINQAVRGKTLKINK